MEELLTYLNMQCAGAKELINSHYKNDSGKSCEDYAKGSFSAYTEVLYFVENMAEDQGFFYHNPENELDSTAGL